MKCQKCGSEMVPGHLYCDICGAEYQIVPDFEPEIENSIAQTLSDISGVIDEEPVQEKQLSISNRKTFKAPSFSVILILVFVCSFFIFMGYMKYTHSANYLSRQALEAVNNYDYYKAAKIYRNIRKEHVEDAYWYIKEAEIKLILEEKQEAYHLAVAAIQLDKNTDIAYDFLLSYLEKEKNYIEMNQYLQNCTLEEIKEKYKKYLCELPPINHAGGHYNEALELTFPKEMEGCVYYTLDDSLPTRQSTKYETPIKLGNGTHILKAVYENAFGIISEPVIYKYEIVSDIPMAPTVNLSSGKYTIAEMIELKIEEGTKVYYTTDLTKPNTESVEYTAPIPLPLGESRFNFIAVSEKGMVSEITQRNFMLNIKTNVSIEEAENLLVQKLISTGHILDKNGAVQDRYGVFRYFYKYPISETQINYYVFEEHYMENQINNPLKHFYAVDVLYGQVYKLISDENGNFTRVEM